MTGLVAFAATVAWAVARLLGASPGIWRWFAAGGLAVLAASQTLPPGHPMRADLLGAAVIAGWLVVAAVPIGAYALWIRSLRRRTGVDRPPDRPVGLVQIDDDAALAADTAAALVALDAAVLGRSETLSLAWRAEDGRLAGHLRLRQAARTAEIEAILVAEGFRRQGIGTRLVRAAEAEARARGLERIAATVGSWQAPGFFLAVGLVPVAEWDLGGGRRRIRMERDLA